MIQTSDRNFKDSGKTTDFLAILTDEFDRQSVNNDNRDYVDNIKAKYESGSHAYKN